MCLTNPSHPVIGKGKNLDYSKEFSVSIDKTERTQCHNWLPKGVKFRTNF